jgi:hypothetical protein
VTITLGSPALAGLLEAQISNGYQIAYGGLSLTGTATATGPTVTVVSSPAVPDIVLTTSGVSSYTGQTCPLEVYTPYAASVDLITDIRIGASSGLENRLIDLQGRWLGSTPLLGSNDRYQAVLLRDGGVWQSGTYKAVPAVRSRFGLESYFGNPLLGVFTSIDLTSLAETSPVGQIQDLTRPDPDRQFNYTNFL